MMHTKDQIDHFLRDAFFAVLTFPSSEGLISQLMIFGHAVDGDFYFVSQNDKEIFKPLADNPDVSVLIYKEEEELNDIYQVNVLGKANLIEGIESDEAKLGYETVGAKSPIIANIPFDTDNQSSYTLVKVEAGSISYISFAELKKQIPPTTLKRA